MKIIQPKKPQFFKNPQLNKIFKSTNTLLVYIFGSQVAGDATRESDVDVAVLLEKNLSDAKRFNIRLGLMDKLSRVFKKNVDVIVLNDTASIFFKYVIITEGQNIYEKSEGQRGAYESGIMGRYFDFQPFLDLYNKRYVQNNI